MSESDNDTLIMDMIRRRIGKDSITERTRFAEDLHLNENGKRMLFAFIAEAFAARGNNLPARGFYLSNFMACATPGQVQEAIRGALGKKSSHGAAKGGGHGSAHGAGHGAGKADHAKEPAKAAASAESKAAEDHTGAASTSAATAPADAQAASEPAAKKATRGSAKKKPGAPKAKKKAPAKKAATRRKATGETAIPATQPADGSAAGPLSGPPEAAAA